MKYTWDALFTTFINKIPGKEVVPFLTPRCSRYILNEADCISHSTNTLGKGMNPIILPPAMGK